VMSRGLPVWFRNRRYEALAPTRATIAPGARSAFDRDYDLILESLDPEEVLRDLGDDAVLLCWEAPGVRSHRRRVAEWLEESLGIVVPELGFSRNQSPAYADAQPKGK
jgi:hypothetical protein